MEKYKKAFSITLIMTPDVNLQYGHGISNTNLVKDISNTITMGDPAAIRKTFQRLINSTWTHSGIVAKLEELEMEASPRYMHQEQNPGLHGLDEDYIDKIADDPHTNILSLGIGEELNVFSQERAEYMLAQNGKQVANILKAYHEELIEAYLKLGDAVEAEGSRDEIAQTVKGTIEELVDDGLSDSVLLERLRDGETDESYLRKILGLKTSPYSRNKSNIYGVALGAYLGVFTPQMVDEKLGQTLSVPEINVLWTFYEDQVNERIKL